MRLLLLLITFAIFQSCKERTNYDRMLSNAISKYEWDKADLGLENCPFNGPLILEIDKNLKNDTIFVRFGWYHIHKKDTVWIYYEEHIKNKSTDGVSFSNNIDDLRSDWFDIEQKK